MVLHTSVILTVCLQLAIVKTFANKRTLLEEKNSGAQLDRLSSLWNLLQPFDQSYYGPALSGIMLNSHCMYSLMIILFMVIVTVSVNTGTVPDDQTWSKYLYIVHSLHRDWQIPLPDARASASLCRASDFLVHNLISDKLKSRSDKSFENPFVGPCLAPHTPSMSIYPQYWPCRDIWATDTYDSELDVCELHLLTLRKWSILSNVFIISLINCALPIDFFFRFTKSPTRST